MEVSLPSLSTWLLDCVEYSDGLKAQEVLVSLRQNQKIVDTLLLLEHPPVITLGRGAKKNNILASTSFLESKEISLYETGRGGDVTFHGPGQIVAYPILQLDGNNRDIRRYMRNLEEVIINTLSDFKIEATRIDGLTGVWVGKNKIAAQGVRVAKWVTSHGLALNVNIDLDYFKFIVPCGISDKGVTSISEQLGHDLSIIQIKERIIFHFGKIFQRKILLENILSQSVQIVITYKEIDNVYFLLFHNSEENSWELATDIIAPMNETPAEATERIFFEQTGLKCNPINLNCVHDFLLNPLSTDSEEYSPIFNRQHSVLVISNNGNIKTSKNSYKKVRWLNKTEAKKHLSNKRNIHAIELAERLLVTYKDEEIYS